MSASRLLKVTLMRVFRIVSGAVAALTLVGGLAISEPSAASDRFSPGAAAAVGVLGGLAIGGAIAASQSPVYGAPVYAPPPPPVYYSPEPVYYAPPPPVYPRALQSATTNGSPAGDGSRVAARFATDRRKGPISWAFSSTNSYSLSGFPIHRMSGRSGTIQTRPSTI